MAANDMRAKRSHDGAQLPGLTLALAMALRDHGLPAPAALGLICPWADLAIDIDEMRPVPMPRTRSE
jgi:acetyl esterase/lipase